MLAVVKTLRTKKVFSVKGDIPVLLLRYLRKKYGKALVVSDDENDYVDLRKTDWYKKQKLRRAPGKSMKMYRARDQLTQAAVGKKLGGLSAQKVSDMENNRRGISKNMGQKLSFLFGTAVEKFL